MTLGVISAKTVVRNLNNLPFPDQLTDGIEPVFAADFMTPGDRSTRPVIRMYLYDRANRAGAFHDRPMLYGGGQWAAQQYQQADEAVYEQADVWICQQRLADPSFWSQFRQLMLTLRQQSRLAEATQLREQVLAGFVPPPLGRTGLLTVPIELEPQESSLDLRGLSPEVLGRLIAGQVRHWVAYWQSIEDTALMAGLTQDQIYTALLQIESRSQDEQRRQQRMYDEDLRR